MNDKLVNANKCLYINHLYNNIIYKNYIESEIA